MYPIYSLNCCDPPWLLVNFCLEWHACSFEPVCDQGLADKTIQQVPGEYCEQETTNNGTNIYNGMSIGKTDHIYILQYILHHFALFKRAPFSFLNQILPALCLFTTIVQGQGGHPSPWLKKVLLFHSTEVRSRITRPSVSTVLKWVLPRVPFHVKWTNLSISIYTIYFIYSNNISFIIYFEFLIYFTKIRQVHHPNHGPVKS